VDIIQNACASGANAVGEAWERVRYGFADRVLVGGYDALCELVYAGFDSLQALSPTVCRPFDQRRDGLALGEGVAMFALESLDSALERSATILGEIVAYFAATDCHHLTQPHPEGNAALTTMTEACRIAGLSPGDIDYVNAHGTSTPLGDEIELRAIERMFGKSASKLSLSSTKSAIGHLLGAAGAVETIFCALAIRDGIVPPTLNLDNPSVETAIDLTPLTAKKRAVTTAMSNSFGFGGTNAAVILTAVS
jgi:3-oxoacyl-[acyl-carrier-protein] synthase II